jgi:cold shock protein
VENREERQVLERVRRSVGTIWCWFNGEGGYGFIQPTDGGDTVFVHHTCVAPRSKARSLKEGMRVSYEVTRKKMGGLWAQDVRESD